YESRGRCFSRGRVAGCAARLRTRGPSHQPVSGTPADPLARRNPRRIGPARLREPCPLLAANPRPVRRDRVLLPHRVLNTTPPPHQPPPQRANLLQDFLLPPAPAHHPPLALIFPPTGLPVKVRLV